MKNFDVIGSSMLSGIIVCSNPHPDSPQDFDNQAELVEGINKYPEIESSFLFIHDADISMLIIDKKEAELIVLDLRIENRKNWNRLVGFCRRDDRERKFSVRFHSDKHATVTDETDEYYLIRFYKK